MRKKKISNLLFALVIGFAAIVPSVTNAAGGSMIIPGATIDVGGTTTLTVSVRSGQDNLGVVGGMGSVVSNDSSCVSIQSVQGASVVDGTNFSTFSNNVVSSVATVTIKGKKNCETTIKVTGAEIDYSNLTADENMTFISGIIKVGSTQPVQPDNPSKPDNPTKPDDSSEPSKPDNPPQPTKNDPTPVTNKSSNAFLRSLSISGYTLHPRFNKNTTNYSITVNNNIKSLGVTAYPEDSKSKVSISGNRNWKVGVNNITITVTAENGNKKVYTVAVTRKDEDNKTPEETKKKSSDNNLSKLVVTNGELKPEFDKDKTEYNVTISNDVNKLDLSYVTSDSNAKVEVSGNGDFEVGKAKPVTVKVTAEDGSIKIYTINVTKSDKKADAKLKNLEVEGHKLTPKFKPNKYDYDIDIDSKTKKLKIKYKTDNPKSKVEIEGNKNLKEGNNTILVKVTDPAGFVQYYKINAYKKSTTFDLFGLKIPKWLGYLLLGLLFLLLLFLIILLIKRKNREDDDDDDKDDDVKEEKTQTIPNIEIKPEFNFNSRNGTDDDYVAPGGTLNQSGRDLSDDDENDSHDYSDDDNNDYKADDDKVDDWTDYDNQDKLNMTRDIYDKYDYDFHDRKSYDDVSHEDAPNTREERRKFSEEKFDPFDDVVTKDEVMYAVEHDDDEMLDMLKDQQKLNKKKEDLKRKYSNNKRKRR